MRFRPFAVLALLAALTAAAPDAGAFSSPSGADASALAKRGAEMVRSQRFEEAVLILEQAVKADPVDAGAWSNLGFSRRKTSDPDGAMEAYNNALAIDPRHRGANEYLGQLLLQRGEPDKAAERLKVLAEVCPNGCEERTALAEALDAYTRSGGTVRPK